MRLPVTGLSRAALDGGARDVVLFTDPANPTSNALYQRLGYVNVADFAGYKVPTTHHKPGKA